MSLIGLLIFVAEFWTIIDYIYIKRSSSYNNNRIFYSAD